MDRSLTIHTILRLFALLVMALLLSKSIGAASNQDNGQFILVLHSYNPTLTWTANISQGILAGMGPLPANTSISFEYLNWKNYPTEENLNLVEDLLRYRYKNLPVDLLITTDDAALIFGLKHRTEIFSDAPIIFTALNGFDEIRPDTYPKTTGVIEAINPEIPLTAFSAFFQIQSIFWYSVNIQNPEKELQRSSGKPAEIIRIGHCSPTSVISQPGKYMRRSETRHQERPS
jgi:hypothetical protein